MKRPNDFRTEQLSPADEQTRAVVDHRIDRIAGKTRRTVVPGVAAVGRHPDFAAAKIAAEHRDHRVRIVGVDAIPEPIIGALCGGVKSCQLAPPLIERIRLTGWPPPASVTPAQMVCGVRRIDRNGEDFVVVRIDDAEHVMGPCRAIVGAGPDRVLSRCEHGAIRRVLDLVHAGVGEIGHRRPCHAVVRRAVHRAAPAAAWRDACEHDAGRGRRCGDIGHVSAGRSEQTPVSRAGAALSCALHSRPAGARARTPRASLRRSAPRGESVCGVNDANGVGADAAAAVISANANVAETSGKQREIIRDTLDRMRY